MLALNSRPAKGRTARGAPSDEAYPDALRRLPGPGRAGYQPQTDRSVISIGTEYCAAKPVNVPPQDWSSSIQSL